MDARPSRPSAQHNPDLVFLDVQMPDVDGFGVVQALGVDQMPAVIFVTAYDEYALKAFEVNALDYLLKPFDAERFKSAFQRAREHIDRVTTAQAGRRLKTLLEQVLQDDKVDVNTAAHASARGIRHARGAEERVSRPPHGEERWPRVLREGRRRRLVRGVGELRAGARRARRPISFARR